VLGAARSFSEPSVGGTATVVVVAATGDVVTGDVVTGDVVTGDVVVPVARVVVVVAPTAVVLVVFAAVVVVVVVDVLPAMKVKASASVSV